MIYNKIECIHETLKFQMIYATCILSATMHAYTWYIVLQPNKGKENLITVQNSVVSLFNNQRM